MTSALSVELISGDQAQRVTQIEEGQFSDVKARAIAPSKLSHTISALGLQASRPSNTRQKHCTKSSPTP